MGFICAAVAGGLYYGIWWRVDPELQVMVFMHTPLAGLDLQGVGELMAQAMSSPSTDAAKGSVPLGTTEEVASAQMRQAAHFVGTVLGWELLAALSVCTLAMFAGGVIGRVDAARLRRVAMFSASIALVIGICAAVILWFYYGGFEPKQWRTDIGILIVGAALVGLIMRRGGRKLGGAAASLLIVSGACSSYLLYVLVQFGAIETSALPAGKWVCMMVVFLAHSLFGWILLAWAWRTAE